MKTYGGLDVYLGTVLGLMLGGGVISLKARHVTYTLAQF